MAWPLAYLVFTGYPVLRAWITVAVVLACVLVPAGKLRPLTRSWGVLARRRGFALAGVFLFAFLATAWLSRQRGYPQPYVHDEFSYLLAADTFAHGRLTNPTPPAWEHFETEHVLIRPSYMSKYPPGQGLAMALGQMVMGHPMWGVWLSGALAAMAVCWALYGALPARWALLGGILISIHPQMLEWGQRYWGGDVAVLGGALLMGALVRIRRRPFHTPFWHNGLLAGLGMLILANSRPFEGLILTLLVTAFLVPWRSPAIWRGLLPPLLLVLVPGAIWMGYYNYRITGHPLRMPYAEHHAQYGSAPLFLFQRDDFHPVYHNPQLQQFGIDQHWTYWEQRARTPGKIVASSFEFLHGLYESAVGNVESLLLGLLIWPWAARHSREVRRLSWVLVLFALALLSETYMYGHYAAPAAALCALLVLAILRRLCHFKPPLGRLLVRVSIAVAIAGSAFWWVGFHGWKQDDRNWISQKMAIERELESKPGRHLVIVHYGPNHNVHDEWVYNSADIPGAKVVWARDLGESRNRDLLSAFADRKIWRLDPDNPAAVPEEIR